MGGATTGYNYILFCQECSTLLGYDRRGREKNYKPPSLVFDLLSSSLLDGSYSKWFSVSTLSAVNKYLDHPYSYIFLSESAT
jgi:hypothetical protein